MPCMHVAAQQLLEHPALSGLPTGMEAGTSGGVFPATPAGPVLRGQALAEAELRAKPNKELQDLLKQRGLPVSGNKEALVQRLLGHQQRQQKASAPP
jgi:hypothetical protein